MRYIRQKHYAYGVIFMDFILVPVALWWSWNIVVPLFKLSLPLLSYKESFAILIIWSVFVYFVWDLIKSIKNAILVVPEDTGTSYLEKS